MTQSTCAEYPFEVVDSK